MESNGFSYHDNKTHRFRVKPLNSKLRVQSREQSTAKSHKLLAPITNFPANGLLRVPPAGNRNLRETQKAAMSLNATTTTARQTFQQAAGLTTADQGLMQKRGQWNGAAFVNEGAKERSSFGFSAVRSILNRKTFSEPEVGHNFCWKDEKNSCRSLETDLRNSAGLKTVQLSLHMDSAMSARQSTNNKVLLLSDLSLARMKKASSIYIDKSTAFHKQRKKQLEKNIGDKHRAQVQRQMCESEQQSLERYNRNISNMNELKNVRKKFWSEKKKRVSSTYVSVAALDTPEVDRYAYGLPEEGKEYTFVKKSFVRSKTNYKEKWDKSVQKAKSIVRILDLKEKVKQAKSLPILKPLTSHSKRMIMVENEADSAEPIEEEETEADREDKCHENAQDITKDNSSNAMDTDMRMHSLLDFGSEVSSFHGTSTDPDTDFEDL